MKVKTPSLVEGKGDFFEFAWNIAVERPVYLENVILLPQGSSGISTSPKGATDQILPAVSWKYEGFAGTVFFVEYKAPRRTDFSAAFVAKPHL